MKNQTKVPMMRIPRASSTRAQFKITRPIVTWFRWTIAPIDMKNVISKTTPRIRPALENVVSGKVYEDKKGWRTC